MVFIALVSSDNRQTLHTRTVAASFKHIERAHDIGAVSSYGIKVAFNHERLSR